jgi:hypothetical protein
MARPRIPAQEKLVVLTVRLDQATMATIDAYAARAYPHFGAVRSARSRVVRTLIQRGLDTTRSLGELPVPGETPAAGPTRTAGTRQTVHE